MSPDNKSLAIHWGKHKYPYILIGLITLINITVFKDLVSVWINNGNYSHGFFIIPIATYLFWRERKELVFPSRPAGMGIFLFALGSIGSIVGIAASELFTSRLSLLFIIWGVSLYYLGNRNFKKVWFPFAFLIFMVPIPAVVYYSATLPMQLFSSKITDAVLRVIGMPSVRQGNIIYLPQYTLEIVEACSGLRSLVSLLALSALYGYLTLAGVIRPLILFMAAIPIAIIINIFRLLLTAVMAYSISPEFADSFIHDVSGLIVFIVALILVVITGTILKWSRKPS
ncbi:MAG: exosortase/archaeosortase family protein [Candidatus Zixiibacteriota bacterium]|nr:MAG: exosortase/archaeosortase family protein [candidate division Zixibacteria bacterium]